MRKVVLADTGFWLGFVDPRDPYHAAAIEWAELLDDQHTLLLLAWPCLYESMRTRLVRNRRRTLDFEQLIRRPAVQLLDDSEYREAALDAVFARSHKLGVSFSLADGVIREMVSDLDLRIDYLLTFNSADFADVCQARQIELLG
ncbi:MAG: hypothetical protein H7330_01180 [Hymenobacteraceae bacterium]|nr:hypothetical protein [Hymenobacteraceae bacterium]